MPVTINGTTGIAGPDGSASTPAVQGTDANTGLFYPAADTVALSTGGTERMRIDSSGNLGLGVTPESMLSVVRAVRVGQGAMLEGRSNSTVLNLSANQYISAAGQRTYITTGEAAYYEQIVGQHRWFTAASGTAGNAITFTQAMSLNASGGLQTLNTIGVGNATPSTSGAGITFPATQSASSDANTLDDYEEGTFTPTVLGSTTAGTGTYTYQVGTYVKVGQLVSVSCLIEITNHTGTGNLRFGNLPFATSNSNSLNRYGGAIGSLNNLALTASNVALLHAQNNSTEMLMLQYPVGGGGQTDVPMDTSFGISFTFTYRCSA